MKKQFIWPLMALAFGLMAAMPVRAAQPEKEADEQTRQENVSKIREWVDGLKFQTGEVPVGTVAKAKVPDGYKYLNPEDSGKYLQLLGNPPAEVLGILFPKDMDLMGDSRWFVVLEYEKEGHVKDDDAAKIDYNDLLDDMKKSSAEINKERVKQGYDAVEIVGWAASPRYDASTHKLYWAKDLKFGGADGEHTLNYNIRMLGREGVLVANAVGGMQDLKDIEKATPDILAMVDFTPGNRYEDYNPKTDHTAEYGIAGLIAGAAGLKVAAKLGIFALIAKKAVILWKPIAIALAVIASRFKKIVGFFRKKSPDAV
ncbi:DUF2167 domain-containing protein [Luteolibacter ambystomatis]|uniref:DUF2167 domain-containing protein n=1 Tax=Luteolibacter ambystomatis TaxID=2824561 RepID=A0A975G957_9BACT|nr:DUF2167 domain-containing protein [Luteolibacter ambystomatis]QUE51273.1 DUF2167 domain-containing protein [Luteolibacter ambystomatis]